MGRGQPQYMMVTKQRRKSGCFAGMLHLIGGIFTLGMWPLMVWLTHRIGPKRKQVTYGYGPQVQQYYPPQQPAPHYGQPPYVADPSQYGWQWDPRLQQWRPPTNG